eukprot:TRINITY_DN8157_c0_g1_i2.p1 TRINITY_DN8157_c0_g1~~TRINITY_DN8157_c0_g1_i2.p1  ORF type:complete len:303 (+),score=76.42 TRINITY_DN8157_c0_g1_i2:137-1045(+)
MPLWAARPDKGQQLAMDVWMRKMECIAERMEVPLEGAACGAAAARRAEDYIDMSTWSEYETGKYKLGQIMMDVRHDLRTADAGDTLSTRQRVEVNNRIRKNVKEMKEVTRRLKDAAVAEGRVNEFHDLRKQVTRTEKLHTERYARRTIAEDANNASMASTGFDFDSAAAPMVNRGINDLEGSCRSLGETLLDPEEDEEFMQLFAATRENDVRIDQGLARVNEALGRVKNQAVTIGGELDRQNVMLDRTGEKVSHVALRIRRLNTKLDDTLRELKKDKFCCYFVLLLMLLGVAGILATQFGIQ